MLIFIIYIILLIGMILYNRCFGLFSDQNLSGRALASLLLLKILAIPFFIFLFGKIYGGIEQLDAGKFYHDVTVLHNFAKEHPVEYLKVLCGLQNEDETGLFFREGVDKMHNWSDGRVKDFFYNDNRILLRLHSLLHFISFKSYYVQALFSCFLSYIGLFFIYKSFKKKFYRKELLLFAALCLFPGSWLYTGALLKEGLTIFILGSLLLALKKITEGQRRWYIVLSLLVTVPLSFLLKPYLLASCTLIFTLYFIINRLIIRRAAIVLLLGTVLMFILTSSIAFLIKGKTLTDAAFKRESEFQDLARGGIFLLDSVKFIRLDYDTTAIVPVQTKQNYYTIKQGVPYIYWEHAHQQDTLYCKGNTDAASTYSLVYILPKAGSTIDVLQGSSNIFLIGFRSLYYTIAHPFFYNAKGILQYYASMENLLIIFSLAFTLYKMFRQPFSLLPFTFLLFAVLVLTAIGFSTPNSGAILRYRAPAILFILMAALYYLSPVEGRFSKRN